MHMCAGEQVCRCMYANVGEGLRAWVHLQEHFGVSSMFLVGIATDLDLVAVLRFEGGHL